MRIGEGPWIVDYHSKLNNGMQAVFKEGPDFFRRLTVNECIVFQDFPRNYVLHGPKSAMFRQIGNAVPPGLARVIAKQILKILEFLETVLDWSAKVKSQHRSPNKKFRRGRGFSLAELKAAGIELWQAKKKGVRIDKRRKSEHKENVDLLRKLQTSTHN